MTVYAWIHKASNNLVKKIIASSFHRNGIAGLGFDVTLFETPDGDTMIAVDFGEQADKETGGVVCAVFDVAELGKGNIGFAMGNSWRGDDYARVLRPALEAWKKENGTNQIGPFAIPLVPQKEGK